LRINRVKHPRFPVRSKHEIRAAAQPERGFQHQQFRRSGRSRKCFTDPNVPPLPPHITLKDAKNFMMMTAGEPELGSVLKNSARQLFANLLPGGKE
jgi:hypothetical protein